MTGKNYAHFSAEDFAADAYFQKWVLEKDPMVRLFWEKWLADNPEKKVEVNLAKKLIYQFNFNEYDPAKEDFDEVWKKIKETQTTKVNSVDGKRIIGIVAAAAVVTVLISTVFFFGSRSVLPEEGEAQVEVLKTHSIETGTDKAVLTLADGSDVALSKGEAYNGKNASSNGKEIIYRTNPENKVVTYNYLTIPRGGQFFIKLADGTQVWLNSESRLKYPVTFTEKGIRQVELVYGEAYFAVSPSTKHKGAGFRVINQAQEINVLGTEFNIKAYKDEPESYTTLVEGKVTIRVLNRDRTLRPEQQLRLDRASNTTVVSKVDVYREISWKNGVFSFKDKTLKEIMKVVSRWYGIDVVFEKKALENRVFNGSLRKNLSITEILETIGSVSGMAYEITDKTVRLK